MSRLPSPARSMLRYVRTNITETYGDPDAFRKVYLTDSEGFVPVEPVGDDLLSDVRTKFYWPMAAVRTELEKEFGLERRMQIYVDPNLDDVTITLLVLQDRHVLYTHAAKTWRFWFPTQAEMGRELAEWHRTARERYQELTRSDS